VLLQDPYDNKRYEIFMNDGQTERTAVRTEIAEDKPEKPPRTSGKKRKSPRRSKAQSKAASTDAIRKRFERDLKLMRDDKNDAVTRQAERDWEKLEPMMSSLDEKGQEELMRLKSEFEKLRQ
jgi:DNA anti-recombination protein RmuC